MALSCEVLIVGAGPTGLVLALWLTKQGTTVRIIDKLPSTATRSRAIVVQARTVELYDQLGLGQVVSDRAHHVPATNFWVGSKHRGRLPLGELGAKMTPYPFVYSFPQDKHEILLAEHLSKMGVEVERETELIDITECEAHLKATVRTRDGPDTVYETAYITGCDGVHSAVRQAMNIGFIGGIYPHVFYVADIEGSGPTINGDGHISFNNHNVLLTFGYDSGTHARIIGIINDESAKRDIKTLTFDDVSPLAIELLKLKVDKVNWFSPYRVHHRLAKQFRKGRVFLVGDAAHVHSPAGGQGMNTGIGDSINLAWKLSAVLRGRADDSLLDTYEAERMKFARRLVDTTDRAFRTMTAESPWANFIRAWVVPIVLPIAFSLAVFRNFLFRTVSQVMLNYRGCHLSEGGAGTVYGGDRLPWVSSDSGSNYSVFTDMDWQVHVYGRAKEDLSNWCRSKAIPLHAFSWSKDHEDAGLVQDAAYLLRPDTYVASVDPSASPDNFERFLKERGIHVAL